MPNSHYEKCAYSVRTRRIRMDAKRNRNKMFADTNESGFVWTGQKSRLVSLQSRNTLHKIWAVNNY